MQIGIVGIGRMGRSLVGRWQHNPDIELILFDRVPERAVVAGSRAAHALQELQACQYIVLAVPDQAVSACLQVFNTWQAVPIILNIATRSLRADMAAIAAAHVRWLNIKIIGHAAEIASGGYPVILIDQDSAENTLSVQELFGTVGRVTSGAADAAVLINTIATREAVRAARAIDAELRAQNIDDELLICGAIGQVAAATLRAVAYDDLGPFAQQIAAELSGSCVGSAGGNSACYRDGSA